MLSVLKVWYRIAGIKPPQKAEHIGLYVRIGVLIDRQAARRVLDEQHTNPIALRQLLLHVVE